MVTYDFKYYKLPLVSIYLMKVRYFVNVPYSNPKIAIKSTIKDNFQPTNKTIN